ncbi:uncharacterized protein LOC131320922 [Rhododendron vialii]|uniref:uncharacterized protein LOC131320922 n=1 Tax=Rhododendron vialii TaxID=182163 RepID=UPI00265E7533|nr:uncharacterized protein LOC131320922 [Rhododendron vialii]
MRWPWPSPIDRSLVGDCSLFPANLHLRRHYHLTSLVLFSFFSSPAESRPPAAARCGNVRGCCCALADFVTGEKLGGAKENSVWISDSFNQFPRKRDTIEDESSSI